MSVEEKKVLKIQNVTKSYGNLQVLRNVSLEMDQGEVVALIGPSGSGKTTLLRCINLLEEFQEGQIFVAGEEMGYWQQGTRRVALAERQRAKQRAITGMAFQSFNLFPHMSATQNVALGLVKVRGMPKKDADDLAAKWLDRVGLSHRSDHYPSQMSGGQQQRVAIARAIAMSPQILLLDEITSALDPALAAEVLSVVSELAREGMTMLLVTHEMRFAYEVSDRIVFMEHGEIVESGHPKALFETDKSARMSAFLKNTSF